MIWRLKKLGNLRGSPEKGRPESLKGTQTSACSQKNCTVELHITSWRPNHQQILTNCWSLLFILNPFVQLMTICYHLFVIVFFSLLVDWLSATHFISEGVIMFRKFLNTNQLLLNKLHFRLYIASMISLFRVIWWVVFLVFSQLIIAR